MVEGLIHAYNPCLCFPIESNVGKLLENYGLLDEALYVGDEASKLAK